MRPKNACTVHGSKSVQLCMPNWMLYCVLSVFRWLCNRNRNPDMCAVTIHRQLRIAYLRIKRKSNSFLHWLITIIIIIIATDQLALCSYEIAVLREITHLLSQTHTQTLTHAIACCLFFFQFNFILFFHRLAVRDVSTFTLYTRHDSSGPGHPVIDDCWFSKRLVTKRRRQR